MAGKVNVSPDLWLPPLLVVIGMGMGKADLSAAALGWIDRADVLAGGSRFLEAFPEHSGQRIVLRSPLEESLDRLRHLAREARTAVLASGDPFFFGIGRRLVECFGSENIVALPGVTAVQALFARLGEPWEDVKALSLHGRGAQPARALLRELRFRSKLVVFTDPLHTPNWIAQQLLKAGVKDRAMVVAEDLGLPTEAVRRLSIEEVEDREFSSLNLVAILGGSESEMKAEAARPEPVFGFPEADFHHQAGLITKLEVRAVVLAHLQLQANLVLWDLGAGSGSVAIEASRIAPLRRVVAVEGNATRFQDLRKNVMEFGCFEIEAIHGNAAEVLDGLPDPDRVFIGGSGVDLGAILHQVANRLRPKGRVVQTAVTLETLETIRAFWKQKSVEMSVTQLQINRSSPIGARLRFEAVNPVFVVTVWR